MDEEIIEVRICEIPHLFLKPNVLYRFTVAEDCEACVKAAKDAEVILTVNGKEVS